jgi:hypothetical protein
VWQAWEDSLCSGCSQPRDESMDPDGPDYRAQPVRCAACETAAAAEKRFRDSKADMAGLYFPVVPVEPDSG